MPDIRLTDEEREGLWDASVDAFGMTYPPQVIVAFVTAALSAVPRLALASPMVGELVMLCREAMAHIEKVERYDYDEKMKADPVWMGEYMPQFCPSEELDTLRAKLAALTGEEQNRGTD